MRNLVVTLLLFLGAPFYGWAQVRFIEPGPSGTSAAVVVPDHLPLLHTAQILPANSKDSPKDQVHQVFEQLAKVLRDNGSALDRVVKLNAALGNQEAVEVLEKQLAAVFSREAKPALSLVIGQLPVAGAVIALDAVATLPPERKEKNVAVSQSGAVLPPGTRVWVSGQVEADGGDLAQATRLTMEGLRRTLQHLKLKDTAVVQLKAFVQPMAQVASARKEMEAFFGTNPVPPLVFIEWQSKLPIEIELIAHGGPDRGGWPVEYLGTPELKQSPVFSRVARVNYGPLIYVSGLHPRQQTGSEEEIVEVFTRLGKVLESAGSDFRHLAKATYYVTDEETTRKMRELRPRWYDPERPPAASLAAVAGTGRPGKHVALDMIAVPALDRDLNPYGPPTYGFGLTEKDALAGWISLWDGKSTFGWKDARIADGSLTEGTTTSAFGDCEIRVEATRTGVLVGMAQMAIPAGKMLTLIQKSAPGSRPVPFKLDDGFALKTLLIRPTKLTSLFNGKDLTGWKRIDHPRLPETNRPNWKVEDGVLRTVGGPGALEFDGDTFGDFVLQVEARSRLRHTNGGIFFRAIPGDFMNGYEAQVYTRCLANDPNQPAVWATGALDDRQNARLLASRDGLPFTMTILAKGPHLATWVNGHQTVDWTDTRPTHINPRQGSRLEAGALQLQAHDAATDLEFRSLKLRKW